eukprot:638193-Rhodomonas_salina.3
MIHGRTPPGLLMAKCWRQGADRMAEWLFRLRISSSSRWSPLLSPGRPRRTCGCELSVPCCLLQPSGPCLGPRVSFQNGLSLIARARYWGGSPNKRFGHSGDNLRHLVKLGRCAKLIYLCHAGCLGSLRARG